MLHVVCCTSFVCSFVVHGVKGEIMVFFPLSWFERDVDLLYFACVSHVVVGCRVSYVLVHVVCCMLYAVRLLFVLLLYML